MEFSGYDQFQKRAAFARCEPAGYICIQGPDQVDFLQRQTTNDIRMLAPGQALPTVLTSPTARILEVLYLFLEPSGDGSRIAIIPISGNGAGLARYLKSRIFFMDKVSLSDSSADTAQLVLGGPGSASLLSGLGVEAPATGQTATGRIGGIEVRLLGQEARIGLPYRILAPAGAMQGVEASLIETGAARLSPEAYEIVRVEAGLPAGGHELTEEFTPLEIRLQEAISSTKGCYTGQEIIARQITYDKITRQVAGLRLSAVVPAGAQVQVDGKPVGVISSAVLSPRFGPIALAVIKRPYHETGTAVTVQAENQILQGTVVEIPFRAPRK